MRARATPVGARGEVIDGGTHRHGVGVVAVVHDENAVRELISSPRRPEKRTWRAPSASASGSMPSRLRGADRGQRVGDVVILGEVELERRKLIAGGHVEADMPSRPSGSTLSARTSPCAATANVIVRTSSRRILGERLLARRNHTGAAGRQLRDQLGLRLGDLLDRPHELEVDGPDVRDHPDVGMRDLRQLADLAHAAHRHLEHHHLHTDVRLEHGQRQADLGVEVLAGSRARGRGTRARASRRGCPSSTSSRSSR